jgi:hypothetical protein
MAQTAAAIVLLGTNLLPSVPSGSARSTIEHFAADPFSSATTRAAPQGHTAVSTATEIVAHVDVRWNRYVVQRLAEIRAGAHDFSGLRIPSGNVIDRAWDVAVTTFPAGVPPPSVLPTEDGNVAFVWHKSGWNVEVEVGPEETTVWAFNRNSGRDFSGSLGRYRVATTEILSSLAID